MSLVKAIASGKEWRKIEPAKHRYCDKRCKWSSRARQFNNRRRLEASNHELSAV